VAPESALDFVGKHWCQVGFIGIEVNCKDVDYSAPN
jgi:hypothetical protein|tara:strand:+ start:356 stop:463 length:108 start_codon:yes stop_codon:yes gene_type:complete